MAMIRTSRSLLLDRPVCVQRRVIRDDGMAGTYQDYQVIVPKYWTRIYPDHHQLRNRYELGELPKNSTHRAVAEPSTNGKSIKVGDRFFDYKNNLMYDVVEVHRPAHKLHYGAMTQFSLIIVQDDSPTYGCDPNAGLAASFGTAAQEIAGAGQGGGVGGNGAGGEQTHFLLRHFEVADLDNIRTGAVSYGDYDGFFYGHVDQNNDIVAALIAQGKTCFRYFSVMDFPQSNYNDTWYNWLRTNFQNPGTVIQAGLVNSSGAPGVFRYPPGGCLDRQFIDWSLLNATHRQLIADKMFELAPGCGIFLDQTWVHESPIFFFSEPTSSGACGSCAYCATYASISPAKWPLWQASIMAFYDLIDQMAAARGLYNLKNGEHRTIGSPPQALSRPLYYENSATNGLEAPTPFENSVIGWKQHPQNVLMIDVPDSTYLPRVLDEFEANGGWVGFSGVPSSNPDVQSAYAQAASIRALHLG